MRRHLRRLDRDLADLEEASVRLAIAVDCAVVLGGAAGVVVPDERVERVLWTPLFADDRHFAGWLEVRVPT